MKPTDKNIADYFHTTPQTIGRWKRDRALSNRYDALREYFIRYNTSMTDKDKIAEIKKVVG